MNEEKELVRQILFWLWRKHEQWSRRARGQSKELYSRLSSIYPKITEENLERSLASKDKTGSLGSEFVFLTPPDGVALQPIITLSYDFGVRVPVLKIRIGLFALVNNSLAAIGFRFETPETGGLHNFYHTQIIDTLAPGTGTGRLPSQEWLPQSRPALALNAVNAVTLLMSLLLSLYDRQFETELGSALRNQLARYMRDMHGSGQGSAVARRFQKETGGRWRWEPD